MWSLLAKLLIVEVCTATCQDDVRIASEPKENGLECYLTGHRCLYRNGGSFA